MPKNKKKIKSSSGRQGKNLSGDEASEMQADENASTISNASTNMSYQDLDSGKFKLHSKSIESNILKLEKTLL
jgi:hypothetical protein